MISLESDTGVSVEKVTKIKVFGVGGAGGNAVRTMMNYGIQGIDFYAMNTDVQVLNNLAVPNKFALGREATRGLGAGAKPEIGEKAALESKAELEELLQGTDMVFITAGMGKGTGTGASPVIAEIAKSLGVLVVGVVTLPFRFEGKAKMEIAERGLEKLKRHVDSLITIPNQNLLKICKKDTPMSEAFLISDDVLRQAVQGVSEIITKKGEINVDFNDVRTIMENKGPAIMGLGIGHGESRGVDAVGQAINSPLLDSISIKGAKGIVLNITGGSDLTLYEYDEIACLIQKEVDANAVIIPGKVVDEKMKDEVRVTVFATGFPERPVEVCREKVERTTFTLYRPEELSIPTFQRRKTEHAHVAAAVLPREDDIDIPTFLRKSGNQPA